MPALDDFNYWRAHPPQVEVRGEDNPHVNYAALTSPWPAGLTPPVVRVRVTPQAKAWPSFEGPLGSLGGILSPIVALVPTVGPYLSIGLGAASTITEAQAQAGAVSRLQKTPTSAFEPSLAPRPFYVFLPLDSAQAAVSEPWRVPALTGRFEAQLSALAAAKPQRQSADLLTAAAVPPQNASMALAAVPGNSQPQVLIVAAVLFLAVFFLISQKR